jgi:hypothetical protein
MKSNSIGNPARTLQADDESGAEAETSKRKRVSRRDFLNATGGIVDSMEEAAGARYTLMTSKDDGYSFDQQIGPAGAPATMFAVFGFHTKVGNVANTVLNDKDSPGTVEDAAQAIEDYLAGVAKGQWREPGKGDGFARIDLDALAEAIVQVATAAGKSPDKAAIRQRLDDDVKWRKAARQVDDVRITFDRLVGKGTKSIGDLLS